MQHAENVKKAMSLVRDNKDGFVKWTNDTSVRTLIHGFLFHYELLHVCDPVQYIIPGKKLCSHGNECAYMTAYATLATHKGLENPTGMRLHLRALQQWLLRASGRQ